MATEGNGASTEEEYKMDAAIQLAQPSVPHQQPIVVQQVQPSLQQVVVVPQPVVANSVQSVTAYAGDRRSKAEVGVTVAANSYNNQNLGYFKARDDTGSYDENMKPWENDGQSYSFACCTEQKTHAHVQQKGAYPGKQSQGTAVFDWIHSVYHKTGSTRLIIKRKSGSTAFGAAKKNPIFKYAVGMILVGIIVAIIGIVLLDEEARAEANYYNNQSYYGGEDYYESDDSGGLVLGIGLILFAAGVIALCCSRKNKVAATYYELVSQSIPIDSVFYVEREVHQTMASTQCTCCEDAGVMTSKTDISIGYNRSNLSRLLNDGGSTEDFIKFKLDSNQAYNLHQYLNCIIDGSHPQTNGNVVMSRGGGNVLPRSSTFQQSGGNDAS